MTSNFEPLTGHCTCKALTFTLSAPPLITHCCHCTACQRETGTAFVLNMQIETSNLHLSSTTTPPTEPLLVATPAASGVPQLIARCPTCYVAIYSHYGGKKFFSFVRVGTLGEGSRQRVKPDVHIFTDTKVEWVDLSSEAARGAGVYDQFYDRKEVWSSEALERREVLMRDAGK